MIGTLEKDIWAIYKALDFFSQYKCQAHRSKWYN